MQQKQLSQSEMGLSSVTSMLGEISNNSTEGNKLLGSILETFNDFKSSMDKSVFSVLDNEWVKNINEFFVTKNKSLEVLNSIDTKLGEMMAFFFIESRKTDKKTPNKKSINSKSDKKTLNDLKDTIKDTKAQIQGAVDYKGLVELIETMVKYLNKKLYKKMHDFSNALSKFLEFDEKKVEKFNVGIEKLTTIIQTLDKSLKPVAQSMLIFSTSFIILGIAAINPFLPIGIFMLGKFLEVITKAMDKKTLKKDLKEFAMGIGILTLSMLAMTFVPIMGLLKMVGFIFLLGFALQSHKGNKLSKNLIQFATGISILTLAMLIMNEISIVTMLEMVAFIALLGLTLKLFSGKTKTPPLMQFAFGLGLMVLAMFAMNELPYEAMFKTILFLGVLGLVLKLFGPQSGSNFLMIGGGLFAISAGLWIFKQTGFTLNDALILGGTIVGLAGILAIIGIPAVAALVIVGAASLAIIGISLILISAGLAILSSINLDAGKVGQFMLSVSILALGFALIVIPAIPGAIGAALFIPIAISGLLGGLTLALISALTFNPLTVFNFMLSVATLTLGFGAIAIPAIPGAIGAALFLPIAAAGILGALALLAISNIKIDSKSISNFSVGMGLLIDAFKSVGLFAAGKAALKAAALLPIINAANESANLFNKIDNIDINSGKTGLITMIDTLTLVMSKLESWKNDNTDTSIKSISNFVSSFKGLDNANFKSITDTMDKFLNSLSDDKKWNSINNHMVTLANNVKAIVTNINMLNLEKAIALERNLRILSLKDSNGNLRDVIEKLKEMIGLLYENQRRQASENSTPQATQTVPGVKPEFSLIPAKNQQNQLFDPNDDGAEVPYTNFLDALEGATLNVRIISDSGNNKLEFKNKK